jgi:hypothetical protein
VNYGKVWTIKDYFYLAKTTSEESLTTFTDVIDRFPELPIITQHTFSSFSKKVNENSKRRECM